MTEHAPIPAATLILYRERDSVAEHLFVERSAKMAFAAGALVFPGGRVDQDDYIVAATRPDLERDDAAARVTAIRETLEEAGVAVGFEPALSASQAADLRQSLSGGATLSAWLADHAIELDLDALVPFARWRPNFKEHRIFDARFYIAQIGFDAHAASVDATENVHLFWARAADVIARAEAGEAHLIYPTMRNVERLAQLVNFDVALTHLAEHPVRLITPFVESRDGVDHLCIADGLGYPITARPLAEARRG